MAQPSGPSETRIVRDNDFYLESGDCVVFAGKVAFKIHRYRLASDASAFGDMFTAKNELILPDNACEFRALCWALYALPLEIDAQKNMRSFQPNFRRILDLFSISHKYHFESLEAWAKRLLVDHCTPCSIVGCSNPILDSPFCKIRDLELTLRLATRTNLNALSGAAENALMRHSSKSAASLARNLALAEELGMREFQGRLYYHDLVKLEASTSPPQPSTTHPLYNTTFTERQRLALFRGYWSLSHYWRALPQTIRSKPLPRLTLCTSSAHGQCQATWNHIWSVDNFNRNVDPPPHGFGPLEKLEKMRSLSNFSLPSSTTSLFSLPGLVSEMSCGLKELERIIKQLRDTLGDHFLGPQASDLPTSACGK